MELGKADMIAEDWLDENSKYFQRVAIVGSIRRREKDISDLDILAIPKEGVVWSTSSLPKRQFGKYKGLRLNLWFTPIRSWGAAMIWWTGPKGHNIGLCMKAINKGYKFNQYGIHKRDTMKWLGGRTEEEVARLLGWNWKPPQNRG
jgi:DNA polymerase (family 10)